MSRISVIIVAHMNLDCLIECINSIGSDPEIEIVVVNNSHQNRGFGAGCNLGADLATGDCLVFANPDTILSAESIKAMAAVLGSDQSIGIVGPSLLDEFGKAVLSVCHQPQAKNFWIVYSVLNDWWRGHRSVRAHWYQGKPPEKTTDVGVVSGAVMGMRREVFDLMGGFDEKFFLYWEEVDLARRCLDLGYRVVFEPAIQVTHRGSLSTIQPKETVITWFRESRYYFMKKYFGRVYAVLVEGWLAVTEHWPLSLVLFGLIWWQRLGLLCLITMIYNEVSARWNKLVSVMVGVAVGILGLKLPDYYWLVAGVGWVLVDLSSLETKIRTYYVVAIVGAMLWLA